MLRPAEPKRTLIAVSSTAGSGYGTLVPMDVRRLPTVLATAAAIALMVVIAGRVTAGADPAPRDTSPIRIDATPEPTATTPSPDDPSEGSVPPRIRDDDDDDGPDDDDREHDDDDDDDGGPDDDD